MSGRSQTFIISHLSATFRAVWRKRAWSFSFRLCSACVMRALERSRHWRQLAICCANLRSFITCKRKKHRSESEPERWFLLRSLFRAYLLKLQTQDGLALAQRRISRFAPEKSDMKTNTRDSTGISQNALDADQNNSLPEKSCESM